MLRPKKNSYKEFDDEKKFLRFENSPPPPHNLLKSWNRARKVSGTQGRALDNITRFILKLIEWRSALFYGIKTKVMSGINCEI